MRTEGHLQVLIPSSHPARHAESDSSKRVSDVVPMTGTFLHFEVCKEPLYPGEEENTPQMRWYVVVKALLKKNSTKH